jgi:hypothetical protein
MVRQAHHERNQQFTVRPEPVEGLVQLSNKMVMSKNYHLIKMLQQQRHSGMDCRNPGYRDVFIACHPWLLDLGNPCRDDDIFVIKI